MRHVRRCATIPRRRPTRRIPPRCSCARLYRLQLRMLAEREEMETLIDGLRADHDAVANAVTDLYRSERQR